MRSILIFQSSPSTFVIEPQPVACDVAQHLISAAGFREWNGMARFFPGRVEYEPGTPVGDPVAAEFAAAEMDEEGQGEEIVGRNIPEFQQIAPALREDVADENQVIVGDVVVTPNSSVVSLKEAAKYLKISVFGSKTLAASRMNTSNHSDLPHFKLQGKNIKLSTHSLVLMMHLLNPQSVNVSCMKSVMFLSRNGVHFA